MKILIFVCALVCSNVIFAQNGLKFHHRLSQKRIDKFNVELRQTDATGTIYTIGGKNKLKCIIAPDGKGTLSVDFWSINPKKDGYAGQAGIINNKTAPVKFVLSDKRSKIGDPVKVVIAPFRAWTFGVGTTPMRFRQKTDSSLATISATLSISAGFGYTFGWSQITSRASTNYSITAGPFIGLSTAELKKETVTTPKIWDAAKTTTRVNPCLSYGVSITFARNNFGFVISRGKDHSMGPQSDQWSYQDKCWWGLGINTGLGILK